MARKNNSPARTALSFYIVLSILDCHAQTRHCLFPSKETILKLIECFDFPGVLIVMPNATASCSDARHLLKHRNSSGFLFRESVPAHEEMKRHNIILSEEHFSTINLSNVLTTSNAWLVLGNQESRFGARIDQEIYTYNPSNNAISETYLINGKQVLNGRYPNEHYADVFTSCTWP